MSIFVTVGSTSFDDLIQTICSSEVLRLLENQGFNNITFQIGKGTVLPTPHSSISIEWFRYKDDIVSDIQNASLVIGHGGAGTIVETLTEHKPLIAVLNERLMNNHQLELAHQLAKDGYLRYCKCENLLSTLIEHFDSEPLRPFYSEPTRFALFLENVMGVK